jgi:alpha-D-ribose 1-methylphosphonate 5-triphosphate synthase subunit PhnG
MAIAGEIPRSTKPQVSGMVAARRAALAVLTRGETEELAALVSELGPLPAHTEIRSPENGLVMVRGRIGGDGAPFNLGEATVSRAAIHLDSGETGFGYVLGRDRQKARLIALCDALLQSGHFRAAVERQVLDPIRRRCDAARRLSAERTAATRVEFFTLVRGEDER